MTYEEFVARSLAALAAADNPAWPEARTQHIRIAQTYATLAMAATAHEAAEFAKEMTRAALRDL